MKNLYFDNCRITCSNSECNFLIATTIIALKKNNQVVCSKCSTITTVDVKKVIERHKIMMVKLNLLAASN